MKIPDHFLGVDIGTSAIKVAEFDGGASPRLLNYVIGEFDLLSLATEEIFESFREGLGELLQKSGIRPAPVAFSFSSHLAFIRTVVLPSVSDARRVEELLPFEVRQSIPIPEKDVLWKSVPLLEGDARFHTVAGVEKGLVEQFCAAFSALGCKPFCANLSPFSLANLLMRSKWNGKSVLVLDIGHAGTDLIFCRGGNILVKTLPMGGVMMTEGISHELGITMEEAEQLKKAGIRIAGSNEEVGKEGLVLRQNFSRLAAAISRSIENVGEEYPHFIPEKILLTGGSSRFEGVEAFLEGRFSVSVGRLDVFEGMESKLPEESIVDQQDRLGACIGMARGSGEMPQMNFLPHGNKTETKKKNPKVTLSFLLLCLAFAIPIGSGFYQKNLLEQKNEILRKELVDLESSVEKMKVLREETEKSRKLFGEINTLVNERFYWTEFLDKAGESVSANVWLTSIETGSSEGKREIMLRGVVRMENSGDSAIRQVEKFREKLKECRWVKSAKLTEMESWNAVLPKVFLDFCLKVTWQGGEG